MKKLLIKKFDDNEDYGKADDDNNGDDAADLEERDEPELKKVLNKPGRLNRLYNPKIKYIV